MDALDDLPPESRIQVIATVRYAWHFDLAEAEDILQASEPFWTTPQATTALTLGGQRRLPCFPEGGRAYREQLNL